MCSKQMLLCVSTACCSIHAEYGTDTWGSWKFIVSWLHNAIQYNEAAVTHIGRVQGSSVCAIVVLCPTFCWIQCSRQARCLLFLIVGICICSVCCLDTLGTAGIRLVCRKDMTPGPLCEVESNLVYLTGLRSTFISWAAALICVDMPVLWIGLQVSCRHSRGHIQRTCI